MFLCAARAGKQQQFCIAMVMRGFQQSFFGTSMVCGINLVATWLSMSFGPSPKSAVPQTLVGHITHTLSAPEAKLKQAS